MGQANTLHNNDAARNEDNSSLGDQVNSTSSATSTALQGSEGDEGLKEALQKKVEIWLKLFENDKDLLERIFEQRGWQKERFDRWMVISNDQKRALAAQMGNGYDYLNYGIGDQIGSSRSALHTGRLVPVSDYLPSHIAVHEPSTTPIEKNAAKCVKEFAKNMIDMKVEGIYVTVSNSVHGKNICIRTRKPDIQTNGNSWHIDEVLLTVDFDESTTPNPAEDIKSTINGLGEHLKKIDEKKTSDDNSITLYELV